MSEDKVHEWRLINDKVMCNLCDERDELQETLEQLRTDYYTETILSGNLEAERNEALQCIAQLKAQLNGMEQSNSNWRRRALAAEERQGTSAWANIWKRVAKKYYEKWTVQDTLADIGHIALLVWRDRTREARQWAIRMKQERDRYLEQRNSAWKRTFTIASERDKLSMLWEKGNEAGWKLADEKKALQVELDECIVAYDLSREQFRKSKTKHRVEIDTIKQCRCETCLNFRSDTYTCSEWAPLQCVVNYYSKWEAKTETVTGAGIVVSVAKRPDLVIED